MEFFFNRIFLSFFLFSGPFAQLTFVCFRMHSKQAHASQSYFSASRHFGSGIHSNHVVIFIYYCKWSVSLEGSACSFSTFQRFSLWSTPNYNTTQRKLSIWKKNKRQREIKQSHSLVVYPFSRRTFNRVTVNGECVLQKRVRRRIQLMNCVNRNLDSSFIRTLKLYQCNCKKKIFVFLSGLWKDFRWLAIERTALRLNSDFFLAKKTEKSFHLLLPLAVQCLDDAHKMPKKAIHHESMNFFDLMKNDCGAASSHR